MYRTIHVPLDGSQPAESALPVALGLALRTGARLRLVHVHAPVPTPELESLTPYRFQAVPRYDYDVEALGSEAQYLAELSERLTLAGVEISTVLLRGTAEDLLRHELDGAVGTLVVMTAHGAGGATAPGMGDVAAAVVRRSAVPVLLLRPGVPGMPARERAFTHILIALDGSPLAEQILEPATAIGSAFGAKFTLLRVVAPPRVSGTATGPEDDFTWCVNRAEAYLEQVARRLRARAFEVRTTVLTDAEPAAGILRRAAEAGADLVALATHGRGGLGRLLVGSVAERVQAAAGQAVLLYRPQG
jgi:nucleotide-binding universal stress UspA family protein